MRRCASVRPWGVPRPEDHAVGARLQQSPLRRTLAVVFGTNAVPPTTFQEFPLNDDRTQSRHVPPEPGDPARPNPSTIDNSAKAKASPAFREALKKDDAREAQSDFSVDKDLWGRSGAGPDVTKTDPEHARNMQPQPSRREDGYGE